MLVAALLVGYWALMTRVAGPEGHPPNLEMQTNLSAQVDRILLVPHVWSQTKTWDPEGVLSTLPAIATTVLGLLAGVWVRSGRRPFAITLGLLLGGLVLTALGVLWGEAAPPWLLFPVNKSIWTSSFVLLTGGLAAALFGLTYWVVDVAGWKRWAAPFVTYGKNAIAVYVGAGFLADTLLAIKWAGAGRRGAEPLAAALRGALRELAPALRGLPRLGALDGRSSSTSWPSGWTAGGSTSRSEERGASRADASPRPPVAEGPSAETSEIHGERRVDDYAWLREKENPEVRAYLEAENAYTDAVMKPTGGPPGGALRGDARPHQGDRPVRPLPQGRLLLLLAHREGEAVPDLLPQARAASRRRRR